MTKEQLIERLTSMPDGTIIELVIFSNNDNSTAGDVVGINAITTHKVGGNDRGYLFGCLPVGLTASV